MRDGSRGMAAAGVGEFGALLRRLRLAAGLTQEALAERAGISVKAVGELERDPARAPRFDTVTLLADALELGANGRTRLLSAARSEQPTPSDPRPTPGASGDVPRPLTPLFGRAEVIEAITERLWQAARADGARLLVLTGPGGVGKTRLAIAAAERVAGAFPDGVVFVDLAPLRDPGLVLAAIAQGVAIDERDTVQ